MSKITRIEIGTRPGRTDSRGVSVARRIRAHLGIEVGDVATRDVYHVEPALEPDEAAGVARHFAGPVLREGAVDRLPGEEFDVVVSVGFKPGVTDPVAKSAKVAIEGFLGRSLGPDAAVYTSTLYLLSGVDSAASERIARELLANEVIENIEVLAKDAWLAAPPDLSVPRVTGGAVPTVERLDLEPLSDDALRELSRERLLALTLDEMQAIRSAYRELGEDGRRRELGLDGRPTDVELECLAQTWSEHCKHKIMSASIDYAEGDEPAERIDSLFSTYIKGTTKTVDAAILKRENRSWLVSVFHDNAGVIAATDRHHLVYKVETHNSPSALDPYGGAITGIVGVNRDPFGTGMGAELLSNVWGYCFASPEHDEPLPKGLLHPRRIREGVHQGVIDGGNQSGVPYGRGWEIFDERFLGKPLVFCGTVGRMPLEVAGKPANEKGARPGDRIVMVGGRIGKDGIHGATFSSEELHEGSPATAVQIGDPITQKKMADFLMEARDLGLYNCITDCGAGGLSSSVGEMAEKPGGAEIHLEKAPLKYAGLAPWEIFLSEAQERMTLAVPPDKLGAFLDLAQRREVEATALGEYNDGGFLDCYYEGRLIGRLDMQFLHHGVPKMRLEAELETAEAAPAPALSDADFTEDLKQVLGALNVCSKESFVRMYDHEVLAQSVLKQFQGVAQDGPGDAGVIRPLPGSNKGLAVSCGICPKYSDLDCYNMMACAIDEAVRNLIAVGARLGTIAGLDNFCWPDPVQSEKTPDGRHKLAQLVRTCEALHDTCLAYGIPLISGKDSMKNDYKIGDMKISIPPTVLFTAAAVLDDVNQCVTMDVKRAGDIVYVLGETRDEMGGSEYLAVKGLEGGVAPKVDTAAAAERYDRLHRAISQGLVASCHDCSDGGLAAALAETAFAGGYGMKVDLGTMMDGLHPAATLFSESQSRFVVTVHPDHAPEFEQTMTLNACYRVGVVAENDVLEIAHDDAVLVRAGIDALKQAWKKPLQW